ncbi:hypothetical protein KUCAC02_028257 [Chaenocephalus aceratus]|uniref:Uncharacterized protein n=1 Tax=Chaenocephalus aceratus TaxID=36190 RepID=A0ACB9X1E6_CHAAC|nr:hypothetical protein KUCAC02_028257 [Chaenocephalus aceratus]
MGRGRCGPGAIHQCHVGVGLRGCMKPRSLTSAARYRGVQTGPLGDVDLGQLLGAGRVDADRLQQELN